MSAVVSLPSLREDLKLLVAAPNRDGSPAWMVQDPVTNRFYRLGWLEFELLSRWHFRSPELIIRAVQEDTQLEPTGDDVMQMLGFFKQHHLLRIGDEKGVADLEKSAAKAKPDLWKWLLHNYLFIRLPLFRPDRWLKATAPFLSFFYSKTFAWFTLLSTVTGVILASRQWDVFLHTFSDFLSPSGFVGYGLALMFAKTLHELGHAYTATRYNVRVAHMGVAFLVMWPMLYTDTSESWKLIDRRKRFNIAAAGVTVELAIAGFATLAWSVTQDGALRSTFFFLATTSWLITMAINASPFMRFDGYYLLSDALDIPNLHDRAGAAARATMRRTLLGFVEPEPEHHAKGLRRWLVSFAYFTWAYRFTVFIGIAVAVYIFFFKLLGIFLFAVEIIWFVFRPMWMEVKVWIKRRGEIKLSRIIASSVVLLSILFVLLMPWRRDVRGEAWMHAEQSQAVYSPLPGRVVSVHAEGMVKAGEPLIVLDSPDTRSRAQQAKAMAESLALQFDQSVGRTDGAERRGVIAEQLSQQLAEMDAQLDDLKRLQVRAPFDGQLLDYDRGIKPGVWLNSTHQIAVLVDTKRWVVDALIDQQAVERIKPGGVVKFYLRHDTRDPILGEVVAVDSSRAQSLPHPMMATDHGGRVPATKQNNGSLSPRDSLYRVRISIKPESYAQAQHLQSPSVRLGSAVIAGDRQSFASEWATAVMSVLIRESGF
jgi:putative peptide zinc metalloprotease protein